MGGENPYLDQVDVAPPERPYTLTFVGPGGQRHAVAVDPERLPTQFDGRPGSILSLASANGIAIDHACGGVCACSTCHVVVRQGLESCNESTDDEEDMLDNAPGLTHQSRLACQTVPDGSVDVEVEIPAWNRNLVSEGH